MAREIRFLFQIKNRLQLHTVTQLQARVEEYYPEKGYDGVLSRAFASLPHFLAARTLVPPVAGLRLKGRSR